MATVQQSIDIRVPVHRIYNHLMQFEAYPRFMEEVENVRRLDDTHLHWTTVMANRPVEWDAEITECETDRCIAWHNISGPTNAGKFELQPQGDDGARVTFTLRTEPQQVPGSMAGEEEEAMAQRLRLDLARLKDVIEGEGAAGGAQRSEVHDAQYAGTGGDPVNVREPQGDRGNPRNSPVPTSSYAAGSEGFADDDQPVAPARSSQQLAAEQRENAAGSVAGSQPAQAESGLARHDNTASQSDEALQAGAAASRDSGVGGTAAAVGAAGGTAASAGARASGGKGMPADERQVDKEDAGRPAGAGGGTTASGGANPAVGAGAAGRTGMGAATGANAGASDMRSAPGVGTRSAAGNGAATGGSPLEDKGGEGTRR